MDPGPRARTRSSYDVERRNLYWTGLLILRSALARVESRGLHFVTGHPYRDNEGHLRDTVLVRGDASDAADAA